VKRGKERARFDLEGSVGDLPKDLFQFFDAAPDPVDAPRERGAFDGKGQWR